ncbi:hypothetical protein F2Q68_00041254 [Brassica cretica]|uniref:Uncharacterized protein n=1 Tax=Brassica cretica TaxID=69181 RepID=A0A8S9MDV6_BRACR|nr:hypothetical protein F2Q68_00041254 [Brassica cretica]
MELGQSTEIQNDVMVLLAKHVIATFCSASLPPVLLASVNNKSSHSSCLRHRITLTQSWLRWYLLSTPMALIYGYWCLDRPISLR